MSNEISEMFTSLKAAREQASKFSADLVAAEKEKWVEQTILSVGKELQKRLSKPPPEGEDYDCVIDVPDYESRDHRAMVEKVCDAFVKEGFDATVVPGTHVDQMGNDLAIEFFFPF